MPTRAQQARLAEWRSKPVQSIPDISRPRIKQTKTLPRLCAPHTLPGRVRAVLIERRGQTVSLGDLIEAIYPDPDREPDWAEGNIVQAIHHARQAGTPIENVKGYTIK